MKIYWITGKILDNIKINGIKHSWALVGLFSSQEKAINACLNETYFIGPIKMDVEYEDGNYQHLEVWKDAYFPLLEKGE